MDLKIFKHQPFCVPPWLVPEIKVCQIEIKKSDHHPFDINSLFNEHLCLHSETVHVYTDGSKTGDFVGCTAVMGCSKYTAKLSRKVSSYSAELTAIFKCS